MQLLYKRELHRIGMGKLKNVYSMDERAGVIKALGGKFYADPGEYWSKQEKEPLVPHDRELVG